MLGFGQQHYKLTLYTYFGSFTILSPIGHKQFVKELNDELTQRSHDPNWTGFFDFTKEKGGVITLNLRDLRGIEEEIEQENTNEMKETKKKVRKRPLETHKDDTVYEKVGS